MISFHCQWNDFILMVWNHSMEIICSILEWFHSPPPKILGEVTLSIYHRQLSNPSSMEVSIIGLCRSLRTFCRKWEKKWIYALFKESYSQFPMPVGKLYLFPALQWQMGTPSISLCNLYIVETCQFRPPSILSIFFYLRPHKSYIFGKYRSNPIQWRWFQSSSSRSGRSGWSGMSSKSRDVLDDYFSTQTPCILYFWKPWAESSSMEGTPSIMITIRKVRKARMIRTSSKNTEVLDEFFLTNTPYIMYFW